MPLSNEQKREYQRELMRRRRAEKAESVGDTPPPQADQGNTSALEIKDSPQFPSTTSHISDSGILPPPESPAPAAVEPSPQPTRAKSTAVQIDSGDKYVMPLETPEQAAQIQAERCAKQTREALDTRGWCTWKCAKLNNDRIVVVRDYNIRGYPEGLPVYSLQELEEKVAVISHHTLELVHAAKKHGLAPILF